MGEKDRGGKAFQWKSTSDGASDFTDVANDGVARVLYGTRGPRLPKLSERMRVSLTG